MRPFIVGMLGICFLLIINAQSYAVYDVPNNDNDCPDNCRQVPWSAGSDQWNNGTLPTYSPVECTGLTEGDGTTDNSSAIQTCIDNAEDNTAVYIPAGIYYVNRTIRLRSNVVLRGAKPSSAPYLPSTDSTSTTFKLGSNGSISFSGGSKGSEKSIISGYNKGSTTLNMASGHGFSQGDWISVFEDGESDIPTTTSGASGTCSWCGEGNGSNLIQQFVQVTSVDGNTITISRPLYYTYKSGNNPGAKKITFGTQRAGLENIRLDGSYTNHDQFIQMSYALFCWVKGVETYDAGSGAKDNHINIQWSQGVEVRDSYFHYGRNSSSDRNYGIAFFFWNSDHKIENNILRHHRHSISFEGGGSGCAILYNYIDDNYTDDTSYLGSARFNHGAHPMMNLYEGNIISHITADRYWGSSSHFVLFRNWFWGAETGTSVPNYPPSVGYVGIDIWRDQNYYSVVGNVIGNTSLNANWDNATVRPSAGSCNEWAGPNSPVVYCYDGSKASTSSINHGNYDYKTDGVAYWEGGSDHNLKNSMYYNSRPYWWYDQGVGRPWPAIGPDVDGYVTDIPAKDRYEGEYYSTPAPPKNLRIK